MVDWSSPKPLTQARIQYIAALTEQASQARMLAEAAESLANTAEKKLQEALANAA
jgi:hypothetical protein